MARAQAVERKTRALIAETLQLDSLTQHQAVLGALYGSQVWSIKAIFAAVSVETPMPRGTHIPEIGREGLWSWGGGCHQAITHPVTRPTVLVFLEHNRPLGRALKLK